MDTNELLVTPISSLIREVAKSVAEAQTELDKSSLENFNSLEQTNEELFKIGYEPVFYSIPEASVELKIEIHFEQSQTNNNLRVLAMPSNAINNSKSNLKLDINSSVKFRIVPIPKPSNL